jgi:hypothetical protein
MIPETYVCPAALRKTAVWLIIGSLTPLVQAQEPSPSPTPSGTKLEQVVVTGAQIPLNEAIVPTVRPTSAAYGLDQDVMDVPRNITIISRAQLDDIDVTDPQDFTKLTPSSYTTSNFGNASNPAIRGQLADVFVLAMARMGKPPLRNRRSHLASVRRSIWAWISNTVKRRVTRIISASQLTLGIWRCPGLISIMSISGLRTSQFQGGRDGMRLQASLTIPLTRLDISTWRLFMNKLSTLVTM